MGISKTLFLFAVLLVSCSEAIRIEKLLTRKVNSTNTHPGQLLPTEDYSMCTGSFIALANCGLGSHEVCDGVSSGVFSQSWNLESVGTDGLNLVALTYLTCFWEGGVNDGTCLTKAVDQTENYCYEIAPSLSPSPSVTTSGSASISTSPVASSSPAGSLSPAASTSPAASGSVLPSTSPIASTSVSRVPSVTSAPSTTSSVSPSPSTTSSVSPFPSTTPSVTPAPSTSPSRSASPSFNPFVACHATAVEGYNLIPNKIYDINSVQLGNGSAFSVNLDEYFCDPENRPMTYTVAGNVPTGLELNGSLLSGDLTGYGHYQILVQAWDDSGSNPPSPATTFWIDVI